MSTGNRVIVRHSGALPDLSKQRSLVIDTETSGLSPHNGDRICGIGLGPVYGDEAWYVPIRHFPTMPEVVPVAPFLGGRADLIKTQFVNLHPEIVMNWLRPMFADPGRTWVMQNAKYDLGMFRAEGLEVAGRVEDTMVEAHVHRGDLPQYGLDFLTKFFLKGEKFEHVWYSRLKTYLSATQKNRKNPEGDASYNYSLTPIPLLGEYCLEDIDATRRVFRKLVERRCNLTKRLYNQKNPAFTTMELLESDLQLMRVLDRMEYDGIRVDRERCIELRDENVELVESFTDQIYDLTGRAWNVGSWKERWQSLVDVGGEVYFWMKPERKHTQKYPSLSPGEFRGKQKKDHYTYNRAKSTGRPCWNSAALLEYLKLFRGQKRKAAFEFIRLYREIDTRTRLVNTYIKAYLKGADHAGRIHGSFNQHGTLTGRLSSSNPNLQNVATKKGSQDLKKFEDFFGEKAKDEALARQIRRLFISDADRVLVSIDYSQIEYRLAAYFSCDPVVLKAYQVDPDTDYHQFTADLCGISRDQAKTVNFGTLYGMGAKSLASMLDLSLGEANDLLARIFNARPALRTMIDNLSETARREGAILNPYGRIVRVPPSAPYVALNYLVQGSAGDMMRRAMVRVDEYLRASRSPVRMLVQIHDELLFSMPPEVVHAESKAIGEIMCQCSEITIPLTYDVEVGRNWGQQVALKDWDSGLENHKKLVA